MPARKRIKNLYELVMDFLKKIIRFINTTASMQYSVSTATKS